CLVLEYVAGGSLADRVKGQPQPIRDSVALLVTLARAMDHAHVQGVVHRDLKPANILMQEETTNNTNLTNKCQEGSDVSSIRVIREIRGYSPKITDFGLARDLEDDGLTKTGDVLGTPGYMAPEMTLGQFTDRGPLVDVYALGIILYELLTGTLPFRA